MTKFFEESREQSQIKAKIVADYFFAWATVITRVQRSDRIAYIDLFAGPGRYKDGTMSTPLLILQRAIQNPVMSQRLVTLFNDRDAAAIRALEAAIDGLPNVKTLKHEPMVMNEEVGDKIVKRFEKMQLVPTLFFVDPWGYKGLSLRLVNAVVKDWACECVFFFNYNRINMGLGNAAVREHMDALFGIQADALREQLDPMDPAERELLIVERLSKALNPDGKRSVLPFRFRRPNERTSHHLIFVTKHFLGYDIMKKIMAKESSKAEQGVASFEYNPADARFPTLFELNRPLDDLEGMLLQEYSGRTISFRDLYQAHSVGRPYVDSNYKVVLKRMEEQGMLTAAKPEGKTRRKGTFPDDVRITFGVEG
ncbi:MAG: three-Cys-motif partner protein TcmP [Phycisphaerae bacterium]|nr:three-Cys-motif partner protein TcmP [Phycisphaerae bacterium]